MALTASTLVSSGRILCSLILWPKNVRAWKLNEHLSSLSVNPAFASRCKTAGVWYLCSLGVEPQMITSSMWQTTPLAPCRMLESSFWKFLVAKEIPKGSGLKQKRPNGQVKVLSSLLSPPYGSGLLYPIVLRKGQTGKCVNQRLIEHSASLLPISSGHLAVHRSRCNCSPMLDCSKILGVLKRAECQRSFGGF